MRATMKSAEDRYLAALVANTKPESTKNNGTAPPNRKGRNASAGKKYPVWECHSTIMAAAKNRKPVNAGQLGEGLERAGSSMGHN
jgi:hypothetical protein